MAGRVVEIVFLASTADAEAKMARLGVQAKATGDVIGDSFQKGTTRAGNMLEKLGQQGENFGIPFAGHLTTIGEKFEEADTKGQKFTQTMSTLGGATLLAAGAAMAGVSVEAVKLAMGFQKSVASISGNSDITIAKAKAIGDAFLGTAGYMTMSGNEMAEAFAPVAGQLKITEGHALDAAQALGFMKTAADLAEGSETDLTDATAALSQVMQSFHLSLGQASGASDLLFNVSRSLNVPITQVAAAVDKLHGRLGILMPSMSDVGALMVALGQHGIMGSRGIQVAQTALTKLTSDTPATKTVLDELGVTVQNSQGKFVGMANLIDQLRPKLEGLTQASQENALTTLFGSSAWEVMGQIIGAGVPKFDQATEAATKLGTAHAAAEKQAATFQGQMKILGATLEDVATKIGNILIPIIQQLGGDFASVISWLEKGGTAAEALGLVIAGTLGLAVEIFVAQKAVRFASAIKNMVTDLDGLGKKMLGMASTSQAASDTVVASNEAAGTSFTMVGTDASGAAIKVTSAAETELTKVAATDSTIEADNVAAGASFTAMIPLIGAVGLAAVALEGPINSLSKDIYKVTGGVLGTGEKSSYTGSKGGSMTRAQAMAEAKKFAAMPGEPDSVAQLYQQMVQEGAVKGTAQASTSTGATTALPGVAGSATTANPAQLVNFLQKALGLTKAQAAGIAGNIQVESAGTFSGSIVQGGAHASTIAAGDAMGTGGGYGLAQWTSSGRQAGLAALAKQMGLPQDSVKVQEAYIVQEMKTGYASVLAQLKGASTASQAAQIVMGPGGYENPASNASLAERQADAIALAGGKVPATTSTSRTGLTTGTETLTTGTGTLANPSTALTTQTAVGSLNNTLIAAINKYATAAQDATTPGLRALNAEFATKVADLKSAFDKGSSGLTGSALVSASDALKNSLNNLEAAATRLTTTVGKADSMLTTYGNAAQSGTTSSLSGVLGAHTSRYSATLHRQIERLGTNTSLGGISKRLDGTLGKATAGSQQEQQYAQTVANLIAAGQKTMADELVAAHTKAMATLAQTMYAHQVQADGESLTLQATELSDQTRLISDSASAQLTVAKSVEQKVQDMAAAVVQHMQDVQQTTDDTMAGIAQSIKDVATIKSDQDQGVIDAINDTAQTQIDTIGEKGLFGLALIAQQDKVTADQVKAYWDQQIDLETQQLATATAAADKAENLAQIHQDQVTTNQNMLVAAAQAKLDTTTIAENTKIAAATAHADQAQAHADATLIGPAQIALDMNANAPASQQAVFTAQLKDATGKASKLTDTAQLALTNVTDTGEKAINDMQATYENVSGTATQLIQGAQDTVNNTNDYWNNILAELGATLSGTQGNAGIAEAAATGTQGVVAEQASTQFAGSGMVVNILGVDTAPALEDTMNWLGRSLFQVPVQAGV